MNTSHTKLQHSFFLLMLTIVSVIMFFVYRPFLSALIFAVAFAVVFKSLYVRLVKAFGNRETLAAFTTVLIILLVVLVPLVLIGGLLFDEARDLYVSLSNNGGSLGAANNIVSTVEAYVHRVAPDVTIDVAQSIQYGLQWTVSHLDTFFSQFVHIILGIFIMIIALFYLLRDGKYLRARYVSLSPLSDTYDEEILSKLTRAINSVVRGSLVISVVQGVLAAIGLAVAGVSNPIILGALATIASLIPGIGTSLVMLPIILYLLFTHQVAVGVGLLIWQLLVVGLVDNFMAPYLIKRGMKIHSFFILMSVLGGIVFFGPIGFLLGPIILALFFALLDIYPLIIK